MKSQLEWEMDNVEIYANGQVKQQNGVAFYRLECGNASKEGFEYLKNVTSVEAQMLAIIYALDCLKIECNITAYTNLQFLGNTWTKIKERGTVGQQKNKSLWDYIFQHRLSKRLNIVWSKIKIKYVKDKAIKALNHFLVYTD